MPQRLSDVPLADLVPETKDWYDGSGVDVRTWLTCVGRFEHAIGYGEVFWPDFIEHDGGVFLADTFHEESYQGFMRQAQGNRQAVEAVLNHWHLVDLFSGTESPPTREQIVYLGRLLREMWEAKLRREFPARCFVVKFFEEPTGELLDYEVTFFQVTDPGAGEAHE